jgi:tRNA 2-thiouridine synthesizing protein A
MIGPGVAPAGWTEELDLRGEVCPYTFLKARLALETLPAGTVLRVLVDNEASARDVPRSLAAAGHAVLACESAEDRIWAILARRGPG